MSDYTNSQIAEKLVLWFIKIKYYARVKFDKEGARTQACNDLHELKELYGFPAMKRAFNHSTCVSIGKFHELCREFHKAEEKKKTLTQAKDL